MRHIIIEKKKKIKQNKAEIQILHTSSSNFTDQKLKLRCT